MAWTRSFYWLHPPYSANSTFTGKSSQNFTLNSYTHSPCLLYIPYLASGSQGASLDLGFLLRKICSAVPKQRAPHYGGSRNTPPRRIPKSDLTPPKHKRSVTHRAQLGRFPSVPLADTS